MFNTRGQSPRGHNQYISIHNTSTRQDVFLCRCPLFSAACRKEWTLSARPLAGPVARPSPPLSLWGTKRPVTTLCACAVESWRALGRRGVAPAPRFLICVPSGAVPTLALAGAGPCLSTVATFVACIPVLWRDGPGVVHVVRRPGRRVAGRGLRRRVRLVAGEWCCWPSFGG